MATLLRNHTLDTLSLPYSGAPFLPPGGQVIIADTPANVAALFGSLMTGRFSYDEVPDGNAAAISPVRNAARLFAVGTPTAKSATNVHASFKGNVGRAVLNCQPLADHKFDSVLEARTAGVAGNLITVALIGDSAGAAGVTISESGNAVTIHYEDNVSTVTLIEAAVNASSTLVRVAATGTGATKPRTTASDFTATALTGGVAGDVQAFPGPITQPDVPRNLIVTFTATWDGGDVTVHGTDQFDAAVAEVFASNAGSTRVGVKIFKTVSSAEKSAVGIKNVGASIGYGDKLGLPAKLTNTAVMVFVAGVGEAGTGDATYHGVTPATAPAGAVYMALANV